MKEILERGNVYASIAEKARGVMTTEAINKLANDVYEYALACKKGLAFDENDSMLIIDQYAPPDNEPLRKELWAVMAMYSFENAVFNVVNKYNTCEPEVAVNNCLATLFECARQYDHSRGTKFNTYAISSMVNNVRRDNRNRFIRFPDKLAPFVMHIVNHPDDSDEDIAKELKISVKKVKIIREALTAQSVVSMDEQFEGDSNGEGGTLAAVLDSGEDIASDFCERESENTIANDFVPIIADIYGEDSAFVAFLRTGIAWGYKSMSFYKMESLYCAYLVTKKKLNSLADEIPTYKSLCDSLRRTYATSGRLGVERQIAGTPEEYLIRNLLAEADREAREICQSEQKSKNDCFKPAGSLNYMFTKIFHVKHAQLSDCDSKQAARFRKEFPARGIRRESVVVGKECQNP
jgi:hypothetical protein